MNGRRPLEQITLSNFLSYGPRVGLNVLPLNVLIGPNGSGKSNLIEALAILEATPTNLQSVLREGGGIGEYVRKSGEEPHAFLIGASVAYQSGGNSTSDGNSLLYAIE